MTTISTPSLLTDGTTLFIGGSWRSDIKGSSSMSREQGKAAREFFTTTKTVYMRSR